MPWQYELDGVPIIYIDESGFALNQCRTHGYARQGQRSYGTYDWHAKGRVNAIGAIIGMSFLTLSLFDGHINADTFHAWLTQDLLPKISEKSVIVMDNATFHKRSDSIKAINKSGCTLEFLPTYSPDLNPIEHKWAQAKSIRRKHRCTVNELFTEYI